MLEGTFSQATDHECLPQLGDVRSQVPSDRHEIVEDPDIEYPVSHSNIAVVAVPSENNFTRP